MALSIRNPETERLARELSSESGETITQAITIALGERLTRLRGQVKGRDFENEILSISKRCSAIPDLDRRPADEILGYDSSGVPE